MQTKIHIVEYCDNYGIPIQPITRRIINSSQLLHKLSPGVKLWDHLRPVYKSGNFFDTIKLKHYEDDGDGYYYTEQEVQVLETFIIITKGHFILNERDTSTLNAYNMSNGGFDINGLAYSYSVNILRDLDSYKLYDSDLFYTESGIKKTRFDMYSYHINEPKQEYIESRLDYEVLESLDLVKIFAEFLPKSEVRDNKLNQLGI